VFEWECITDYFLACEKKKVRECCDDVST
jgi:hypothetical protein